jgi:HupE / UreJ protein
MNNLSENKQGIVPKVLGLLILLFLISQSLAAHDVEGLSKLSKTEVAGIYLQLGFTHILPLGLDHILFVLSLFLLNPKLKPILWQATAFTVAHTITLGLAMYGVIKPPTNIVEPVIALSIMYVALENILSPRLKASRIGIVFLFGLIHGMGFASVLTELGLPKNAYLSSLLMFNLGVELGQVTVILAAFLLLGLPFGNKPYYRKRIVIPLSIIIAAIAAYWTVERVFF